LVTVNSRNSSLHQATKSGDTGAVEALIADGADVNATNDAGQTPLILAIVAGQHQLLRPLLRAGANPFLCDGTGLSAIDWAERKGETGLAQSLSKHSPSQSSDSPTNTPKPHDGEHRSATPSVEDAPRAPLSADEKTRRFIAGLKQRMDEKASREQTSHPSATQVKEPPSAEKQEEVAATIPAKAKSRQSNSEPPIEALPVLPKKAAPTELPHPSATRTTPDEEKTAARETYRKTVAVVPEKVAPEIISKIAVAGPAEPPPAFSSPLQKPRNPSKRKRCPQCGAIYNSELLAYCSYDAVALVDADQPVVGPRPPNSSPLLWILILIVMGLGAVAGLVLTSRLFRNLNSSTQTVAAPQPPPSQKGMPVAGRQLAGKELTLPEAEVPGNTVTQPVTVTVTVRVDRAGRVTSAASEDGDEVLRRAAIEAAKKSSFSVEKLRGRGAEGTIVYRFK